MLSDWPFQKRQTIDASRSSTKLPGVRSENYKGSDQIDESVSYARWLTYCSISKHGAFHDKLKLATVLIQGWSFPPMGRGLMKHPFSAL